MAITITDAQIELEPVSEHLPLDGSLIGGVTPTKTDATMVPGQLDTMLLEVEGPAWATNENYWIRNSYAYIGFPYVTESFTLTIGADVALDGWILEFDGIVTALCPDGVLRKGDGSFQIVLASGMLQVDSAPPAAPKLPTWIDTGVRIPVPIAPGPHQCSIRHFTDLVKHTHSVLWFSLDGVVYPIPTQYQNIPMLATGWSANIFIIQIQKTVGPQGGSETITIGNLTLVHTTQ